MRVSRARWLMVAGLAAAAMLAVGLLARAPTVSGTDARPNIVLIVTDDQTTDSLPHSPAVMPFLQERVSDPVDHWVRFRDAFVNTSLCCPSRATILSGRYSHHTGVVDNGAANRFDESATLATWLRGAGYHTGLVGKYFNQYPFGRGHYVPPGWNRWVAMETPAEFYYQYRLNEDGTPVTYGSAETDYSTDVLASKAIEFIASAPDDRPFFLYFAPNAPHDPMTPAPRDATALEGLPPTRYPSFNEADVSDKPAWIRKRPLLTADTVARQDARRLDAFRSLMAVDDAVRAIMTALQRKGIVEKTVVVYLSDNGHVFGEHRWTEKTCVYDECTRTPLFIRYPKARQGTVQRLVSNVDLAPTLLELAGVAPTSRMDGLSLVPLLTGHDPRTWRSGLLLSWHGSATSDPVTGYWAVRTRAYLYSELLTGERELYDLTGLAGRPDPYQLENRAGWPAYARTQAKLASMLADLRR